MKPRCGAIGDWSWQQCEEDLNHAGDHRHGTKTWPRGTSIPQPIQRVALWQMPTDGRVH